MWVVVLAVALERRVEMRTWGFLMSMRFVEAYTQLFVLSD